jgi:hypothetical protein
MTTTWKGTCGRLPVILVGFVLAGACAVAPVSAQNDPCVGDCNENGSVGVNELIVGTNIALGEQPLDRCPSFDTNGSGGVQINELIQGTNSALNGCVAVGPTPTPIPGCAVAAGRYSLTQIAGGSLKVGPLAEFPFPAGGQIIQEVGEPDDDCVHETIVPSDGFTAPVFCVPALSFTVFIEQTGCGVGQIDSDGGSDYTVTEIGDTSDSSPTCNLPHAGCAAGADLAQRIDVTVGDGSADVCAAGTVNGIVTIPVVTTTWSAIGCPDPDLTFNPGVDTLITLFPQILDFTTDAAASRWEDIDGDGCTIAGAGPAAGLAGAGTCLDLGTGVVSTVAAGTIGSSGAPLFDLTFLSILPNTWSGPEASTGATCDDPPVIDYSGSATRCID